MDFSRARGIADAVLYEGYLLYPYTASSQKNKLRWQFGIVVPQAHEAAGTGEHGHQQTEVLFERTDEAAIDVSFRFLHVEARCVYERRGDAFVAVASLAIDGTRHLTFDESIERDVVLAYRPVASARGVADVTQLPFAFEGERRGEDLRDASGQLVGRIVRERWPLAGVLSCDALPLSGNVSRLRVRVENRSAVVAAPERGVVLRTAFVSAHTLLGIAGGAFWSPIDPPDDALARTRRLANEHTWPVLVGDRSADDRRAAIVLSSPIVLADFPLVAPQTDADAFDGTEIDELLTLSVLGLPDGERDEARATDPRARAIVERAEALDAADIARTHAVCESVPTFGGPGPLEAASAPKSIAIAGIAIAKGSSVRLAPKRRADAWDMFLAGKIATVEAIHQDFEGRLYVAVTVDDDPATEYHQWYGRAFFFEPDEVEPLGARV
ncbi:MAG: hypothetical protein NVSMB21_06110 [Vulcanimicrobiaceae bacterium]